VVLDLAMPGVGGLEVAQAIARVLPGVPIVVVTGAGVEPDARDAEESGVAVWLQKGDPLQVENALRRLTAGGASRR
jgi:CheY-like chemotaxis protein